MSENLSKLSQYIEMGNIAVESNDHEALLKFSTEILDMDSENYYGWYFKAEYFITRATNGNMQADGYISAMKKVFKHCDDSNVKKMFILKVINNLKGYILGLVNQKNQMGLFIGTTLDSVYIEAFIQLVQIKEALDEYILIDDSEIISELEELLIVYGNMSKTFPFNPNVNNPSVKTVFEKGIPQSSLAEIKSRISSEKSNSAAAYIILGAAGVVLFIWWMGWGIWW